MAKKKLIKYDQTEDYPITEKNKIQKYDIRFNSAHPSGYTYATAATIDLYAASGKTIGVIWFIEDGVDIEENVINEDGITWFRFPMSKYPYVVDLLRNEGPLYLELVPQGNLVRITSKKEEVGEGE